MNLRRDVVAALAVTVEVCGAPPMSDGVRSLIAQDLSTYAPDAVLEALTRCRRELKGRLTLADIIERIDDGRPGPEQAWATVGTADERATIVATEEAWQAFAVVNTRKHPSEPSLLESDHVAARMAFLESYRRMAATARANGERVKWRASLGHDKSTRLPALRAAIEKGYLDTPTAAALLPAHEAETLAMPPAEVKRALESGAVRAAQSFKQLPAAAKALQRGASDEEVARLLSECAASIAPRRPLPSKSIDWQAEEARLAEQREDQRKGTTAA